jgi:hypothetical protein
LTDAVSYVQDGDLIHIVFGQENSSVVDVQYARFNMASGGTPTGADTWQDVGGAGNPRSIIAVGDTVAAFDFAFDVAINSDRSRIAVHYQGHRDKVMGNDQGRVYIAGATDLDAVTMSWTSPSPTKTAVTPGDQTVQESPRICPGLSGEFHLLYRWDATAGDVRQVRLNTTPALNTDEDTTQQLLDATAHLGKPIAFFRSGTHKVRCPMEHAASDLNDRQRGRRLPRLPRLQRQRALGNPAQQLAERRSLRE